MTNGNGQICAFHEEWLNGTEYDALTQGMSGDYADQKEIQQAAYVAGYRKAESRPRAAGRRHRSPVIGVMGGAEEVSTADLAAVEELGQLIAQRGWVLLNGGSHAGVMGASAKGARAAGGLVVGVIWGSDTATASPHLDVAIVTGMGSARNNINVLSSDVIVACAGGAGTLSEVALALKAGKPVVAFGSPSSPWVSLPAPWGSQMAAARSPAETITVIEAILEGRKRVLRYA